MDEKPTSGLAENSILFTGAVPADSVEEVFRTLADSVGPRAMAYSDGEINERRFWISALGDAVWKRCESIEMIESRMPPGPIRDAFPSFQIKPGATEVDLTGLLPYSRAAIASYEIFAAMRAEGDIPPGVGFQVAHPAAFDAIVNYFPNTDDWPRLFAAWTDALQDEHRRILQVIPAEDLVVQLDYCIELELMTGILGKLDWVTPDMVDEAFDRYTSAEYVAPHFAALPDAVRAGHHICLGTFLAWPRVPISDMQFVVDIAHALAANSGRRIDFFHLPVMPDADNEAFFAPLKHMDVGDADVYLGMECSDGLPAMQRRMALTRPFLREFGVAHYCGYTFNADALPQLLADLRNGADEQTASLGAALS
jgi:hypothetical protein